MKRKGRRRRKKFQLSLACTKMIIRNERREKKKLMTIFLMFSFSYLFILGGSGFLGQHIVRLIEERDPTVKEIRIVDLRPYENRLSK